jgi:hypothetical protein
LCTTTGPIQDSLQAVSCGCTPLPFNGNWIPDISSLSPIDSSTDGCFNASCSDIPSGVLYAQSLICNGTVTTLYTYAANVTFYLNESCVSVSLYALSGHYFSEASQSPLALSFLQTNFDLVRGNQYAVVTNSKGVVVGQIISSMITIEVESFSSREWSNLLLAPCILVDSTMGESDGNGYDVFDLGMLFGDNTFEPLHVNVSRYIVEGENKMVCFENITITHPNTSLILIQRVDGYEDMNAYSSGEDSIVITSGALFCFGGFLVIVFHCMTTFNVPVFMIGIQSICLLLFRGIYFLLLGNGDIPVGGLLDFALIEIPTFIYIGIFIEIILPSYRFFFERSISNKSIALMIVGGLLVNWIIFAILMSVMSSVSTNAVETKSCNCQYADPIQQNNTAQIIRIVYKSFVLVLAIVVVFVTLLFRMEALKAGGIQELYYQVVLLSLGLFFDCVGFVIYYAVNTPTAYFLIVLWFTELVPICIMNGVVAWATRMVELKLFG